MNNSEYRPVKRDPNYSPDEYGSWYRYNNKLCEWEMAPNHPRYETHSILFYPPKDYGVS